MRVISQHGGVDLHYEQIVVSNEKFKETTSEYFRFPQDDEIEV